MKVDWWKKALVTGLCCLLGAARLARAQTQPLVAIQDSELTRAFETQTAANGTPNGSGTTGKQWWPTDWHYFVMPESLEEMFRSDGTAFTLVSDANISAGSLLTNGVPKYPIMISLAAEAMQDSEIAPLTNYVAAGGILFVGSSSFTRNTNGTTRGDFAIANAMGVHMVNNTLLNWGLTTYLTPTTNIPAVNNPIIQDIPAGQNTWRMPAYSEEISWGTDPTHSYMAPHDVWQVNAGAATVLAAGDNYPYITINQYGKGYVIYDAAFQPVIGHGGFAPGMYAYMIFRRSVEWAFQSANLPVPKLSPWPYQYDAAFMERHDLENYTNEIEQILQSAQYEWSNNVKGDYYFCTGQLRQDMYSLINTNTVINNMRTAVSTYGATIGPHNGGLRNQDNYSGLTETLGSASTYDYWHWGQDEILDVPGPITNLGISYPDGTNYSLMSISNSFRDVELWLTNLETTNMRLWCSPYFNSTREASEKMLAQLNVKVSGDEKVGPFPHWTLSTQTSGLRYPVLNEPTSDWFVGGLVAQSLEPWHPPGVHTQASMQTAVDYFYGIGALCNIYSHTMANYSPTGTNYVGDAGQLTQDYILYCANTNLHPRFWSANGSGLYQWWLARSNAQISVNFTTNGAQMVTTFAIKGSVNANTSVEMLIPATTSYCSLQVFTNGSPCSTNKYRIVNNQLVKVLVGTSVSNVVISYYPQVSVRVYSENFDEVAAPALPAGWTTSSSGVESNWATEKNTSDTAPNALFVPDVNDVGLSDAVSPVISLPAGQLQLTFQNYYNLEAGNGGDGYDGGVLEIKIGNGAFADILAAGGSFVTGGYNSVIDTNYFCPLAGRAAWSGDSGGFVPTTVNLPAAAAGTNIQLRWRCGTDNGNNFAGWWVDSISINSAFCECCSSNYPPMLPYQSAQSVPELTPLMVTNTASDPTVSSNSLAYTLTVGPSGAVIGSNGIITWTPTQTQSPSTNTFTTVVSDNGSPALFATNSFTVYVTEANVAPTLGTILPQTINEFSSLLLTNAAGESDIHATTTGYKLLVAPGGATMNASGVVSWSPTQSQSPSTNTFTTVVTNSDPFDTINPKLTATNSFTVTVKEVNNAPTLGIVAPQTIGEFSTLTVTNSATETNIHATIIGYALTVAPSGATINAGGVISWSPSQSQSPSTNTFTTVVTNSDPFDTINTKLTASIILTLMLNEVNNAPTLGIVAPQTIGEFSTLTVTNSATETNIHATITGYTLTVAPSGATINASGVISWSPTQSQSPSTNTFTTVVTNSDSFDTVNPKLTATNSFTVTVKEVNSAPTLGTVLPQTIGEFSTLALTNAAMETNIHATITGYALSVSPAGATINASGVISWSPSQSQSPSTNTFTTVVTNNDPFDTVNPKLTATNSFTVTVKEVNNAPALPPQPNTNVNELTPLTVTNTASESNLHSTTTGYALVAGPSGAGIDSNGIVTWTPAQTQSPSTNIITTVVTNSNQYDSLNPTLTATNSFTVIVNEVNMAPTLGTIAPQMISEFSNLTVTNAATETNIHSVTIGYALLAAPGGAGMDTNGVITWQPGQSQSPSTNTFTTVVTNSNPYDLVNPMLTATNSFTVVVNEVNVAPILPPQPATNVNEQTTLTVTNTAGEPNLHSKTTGYTLIAAPAGAIIDTNGIVTWTPAQMQSPGTNIITTVVTNNDPFDPVNPALTATNSFTVVVNEVNFAPALGMINTQTIGELLTLTVTNTAGEPNIHSVTTGYTLAAGPAGAAVDTNGVVTWTPATNQSPSTNTVTMVVTNSNPYDTVNPVLTATNSFTVIVQDVNLAPVLAALNDVSIDEAVRLMVTNTASEPNFHSVTIGYHLVNPPFGAGINNSGVITWTPNESQAPGTNIITTVVTNSNPYDPVNPMLTATNSFNVFVTEPVDSPLITSINLTNQVATITFTTVPGHTYQLQYMDSGGTQWTNAVTTVMASGNTASQTNAVGNAANRLFQVVTAPEQFHHHH